MRKQEALDKAQLTERLVPCKRVVLIVNGVSVLRERGAAIPAFTIPAESWLLVLRCREGRQNVAGNHKDFPLMDAVGPCFARKTRRIPGEYARVDHRCRACTEGGAA